MSKEQPQQGAGGEVRQLGDGCARVLPKKDTKGLQASLGLDVASKPKRLQPTPRPRRVLGTWIDAGWRYRAYQCRSCGIDWSLRVSEEEEARQAIVTARPCPACNGDDVLRAWGQWEEAQQCYPDLAEKWCPRRPDSMTMLSFEAVIQ